MKRWKTVALVLIAVACILVMGVRHYLEPYNVAEERAAARAAGLPLTPAELPLPAYPPSQDAAPEWKAMVQLLADAGKRVDWKAVEAATRSEGTLTPAAAARVQRLLDRERRALLLVHRAAAKEGRTVLHAWTVEELLPHLTPMRHAALLLQWESLLMAHDGRPVEAVRNQAVGFRIAAQASDDPIMISYLVAIACEAISLRGMGQIMAAYPTPEVAEAVKRAASEPSPTADLIRPLWGETVFGVKTIRDLLKKGGTHTGTVRASPPPLRYHFLEANEAVFLNEMRRVLHNAQLPAWEAIPAQDREGDAYMNRLRYSPAKLVSLIVMPVWDKTFARHWYIPAQRAALVAGADVLLYRAAHGVFPARLSDAAPKTTDAFTGKPLLYRRTRDGFVVYSVGWTGKFTGEAGQAARGAPYFSYPRANLDTSPDRQ